MKIQTVGFKYTMQAKRTYKSQQKTSSNNVSALLHLIDKIAHNSPVSARAVLRRSNNDIRLNITVLCFLVSGLSGICDIPAYGQYSVQYTTIAHRHTLGDLTMPGGTPPDNDISGTGQLVHLVGPGASDYVQSGGINAPDSMYPGYYVTAGDSDYMYIRPGSAEVTATFGATFTYTGQGAPPDHVLVREDATTYAVSGFGDGSVPMTSTVTIFDPISMSGDMWGYAYVKQQGTWWAIIQNPGYTFSIPSRTPWTASLEGNTGRKTATYLDATLGLGAGTEYRAMAVGCDDKIHVNASATPSSLLVNQPTVLKADVVDCNNPDQQPIYTYSWDFGDGLTGTGESVSHSYAEDGIYTAQVTATDGTRQGTGTVILDVNHGRPRRMHPNVPCPECGNAAETTSDPVPTRGLPLGYDIVVNTQVAENNRAMGNATFTYDMHVGLEVVGYDAGDNPIIDRMLIDGDGTRYDFGLVTLTTPTPEPGVYSHFSNVTGGFQLLSAGPPGDIGSAGNYSYYFNSSGQLQQIMDPHGNVQTLSYVNGFLTSVLDVNTSRSINFTNNGSRITSISQGGGAEVTNLTYDSGKLQKVTLVDSSGTALSSRKYSYNDKGLLLSATDNDDTTTYRAYSYTYMPSIDGKSTVPMANMTAADSNTKFTWGSPTPSGIFDTVTATNSLGGRQTFEANSLGDISLWFATPLTGAPGSQSSSTKYDANRNPISASDGTTTTQATYDANGMPLTSTDALGHTWKLTWNGVDLTSSQDPVEAQNHVANTLSYSDSAQPHVPTSITDALGSTWNYGHNTYGQLTSVTPPAGSPTSNAYVTYNTLGLPASATNGNGDVTTFDSYDALGDLTSITSNSAPGHPITTTFSYGGDQLLHSVTRADGKSIQLHYTYDALDTITDQNQTQHTFQYYGAGREISSIAGPLGWAVNYGYDTEGNLTNITDALGNDTTISLGTSGEIDSVNYPDGTSLSLAYNNFGAVRQTTNGRGQKINLHYDEVERLTSTDHPTSGQPSIAYTYNADDTLHTATDGVGSMSFQYQLDGRLSSSTYNYAASGLSPPQTISYTYYPDGSCKSVNWAGVGSWNYTYDGAGRVIALTNPFGETTHWSYDGIGRIRVQNNSNGTKTRWCYDDPTGFLTRIAHGAGLSSLATYDLAYDHGNNTVGLLTAVSEQGGSAVSYDYDALYRLTSEQRTGTAPESNSYSYDLNGNLQNSSYYDAANKINGIAFDGDGNQLALGSTTLSWDDENHLIGAGANTYGYDCHGARVVSTDSGGVKTFYIYAAGRLLGTVNASGVVTAVYTWGASGLVSERLPISGTSRWYHFGPQGETRFLSDETGATVDTYTYTSYGQPVATAGSDSNPFRYGGVTGDYTDPNTGLILCCARWYDPTSTRWLSRDPIGYSGGFNLYTYALNNPVSYVDASGLCANANQLASDDVLLNTLGQIPGAAAPMHLIQSWDHAQSGDRAGAIHYGARTALDVDVAVASSVVPAAAGDGFVALMGEDAQPYISTGISDWGRGSSFTNVPHGGNEMSDAALNWRAENNDWDPATNVCVYKIANKNGGGYKLVAGRNNRGGAHSERVVGERCMAVKNRVTDVYTEREPCGPDYKDENCQKFLKENFPQARVHHSFDFNKSNSAEAMESIKASLDRHQGRTL